MKEMMLRLKKAKYVICIYKNGSNKVIVTVVTNKPNFKVIS